MIIMQFGLGLVVLLVGMNVLCEFPPVCLPAVAKELNAGLVLDVSLVHGVGRLKVQLQREPRGTTILDLGGALGVGPSAGLIKTSLQMGE